MANVSEYYFQSQCHIPPYVVFFQKCSQQLFSMRLWPSFLQEEVSISLFPSNLSCPVTGPSQQNVAEVMV